MGATWPLGSLVWKKSRPPNILAVGLLIPLGNPTEIERTAQGRLCGHVLRVWGEPSVWGRVEDRPARVGFSTAMPYLLLALGATYTRSNDCYLDPTHRF